MVVVRLGALAAAVLAIAAVATASWPLAIAAAVCALIAALTVRGSAAPVQGATTVAPAESPTPGRSAAVTTADAEPAPESALAPEPQGGGAPAPAEDSTRAPYSADAPVVLDAVLESVSRWYDTLGAHLWLGDEPTHTLRLIAAVGERTPSATPLSSEDPVLGAAFAEGSALFRAIERLTRDGVESAVWRYALPVGAREARGVLGIDVRAGEELPSAAALNSVTASLRPSLTAAVALHVARSEMETAAILLEAVSELSGGQDPAEVLRLALKTAMEVSHASTGSVMLPDDETGMLRIVAADGLPSDVVESATVRQGEGIAGWVYASGTPLLVEDLPGKPANRRHGVLSSVSVPLRDGQENLGVLNVGARAFPARFTEAYVRALGILGTQTAATLRAARERKRTADLYLANLRSLAAALESAAGSGGGASARCADLALEIGRALDLPEEELHSLEIAAVLHDLGMWITAGDVSASDRPLSTVDRGLVRAHPGVGADVLEQVPSLYEVAPIVHHHHERFDGSGYDVGLAGEDIPLGSRIIAVADAYLAMTSDRPYRAALSAEQALEELSAASGSQFDPEVVEAFVRFVRARPGGAPEES